MDSQNNYQLEPDTFESALLRGKPGMYKTSYGLQMVPTSGIVKVMASEAQVLLAMGGFSYLGDETTEESDSASTANIGFDDSFQSSDTPTPLDAAGEPEPTDGPLAPDDATPDGATEADGAPQSEEVSAEDGGDETPGSEATGPNEVEAPTEPTEDAPVVTSNPPAKKGK